jgi:RNA polymerase sigma-70 factor (ECF subfamily)
VDREETTRLLERARAGSAEALDALYGRCAKRLLAVIRLRLGPDLRAHLESRDILQAALLKSFRSIGDLAGSNVSSLMAWLARIAENEIRDQADYHHRQRRDARAAVPLEEVGDVVAGNVRSLSSRIILDQESARLEAALESLPEHYREVILLRKFEERSWREVAERLGKTEDACRMLLARAMTALTLAAGERA